MHSVVKRLLDIYDTKDTNDSKTEASAESCEAGQILEGEFIEEPMHEVTGQFYFYCHVAPGYRKFSITVSFLIFPQTTTDVKKDSIPYQTLYHGDMVKVREELEIVSSLQYGHQTWSKDFEEVYKLIWFSD